MELQNLKTYLYEYRDVDNKITDLNKEVYALRSERKELEGKMATILAKPEFAEHKILEIKDDGSRVRISRPEEWKKPWSLSKKELEESLSAYFASRPNANAKDCLDFIAERQSTRMMSHEFAFERTIPKKTN